ncbi:response regulator transcription factor [Catenulispora sp. NL8]|uniref:Response regulator transcription factor n=1 Tax=Catenulispora pinistramenti TaxID=2705254 RepID=A0ABS5L735_9ACTN|nr:response regulator transcription factor [Catenulispora pinistramenti]
MADDQAAVRDGLVALLSVTPGVEVVGEAADGAAAVAAAETLRPDVVLMDLRMPGMDGVEATRQIGQSAPGVRIVVLTTHADDASILKALRAGATGYLTKESGRAEIARAIEAAASGQSVLDDGVAATLLAAAVDVPASVDLTPREAEVLTLIARGKSNTEIAEELFVSAATVKTHINNLFAKIGVRDRVQAVRYALRHGLD